LRQTCWVLLLVLRVVVSHVILLAYPSSVLLGFSMGWPQFLVLILKIRGVALLGHQRSI
jgi:hypothetical protein